MRSHVDRRQENSKKKKKNLKKVKSSQNLPRCCKNRIKLYLFTKTLNNFHITGKTY